MTRLGDYLLGGGYTYRTRSFLLANGGKKIARMYICRQPIQKTINLLLNILSFSGGLFNEARDKIGYDTLYHLYIIAILEDGTTRCIIEKNQDINIKGSDIKISTDHIEIEVGEVLNTMLERTKDHMKSTYFTYSMNNNCQDFMWSFVSSSNMMNPAISIFIKQDISSLLKRLPSYVEILTRGGAALASDINRFIQTISRGYLGFHRGGLVV